MLNRENNPKYIHKLEAKRGYIYIFISFKITHLKRFKKNIFDNSKFINRLFPLALDEIYLIE